MLQSGMWINCFTVPYAADGWNIEFIADAVCQKTFPDLPGEDSSVFSFQLPASSESCVGESEKKTSKD